MKKLLRYLVNTILFIVLWGIQATIVIGFSFAEVGARPSASIAIGGIVAIIISYRLVKRINKSNLWARLFDETKAVNDVVEEKKVEVIKEKPKKKVKVEKEGSYNWKLISIVTLLVVILVISNTFFFPQVGSSHKTLTALKYKYIFNTYPLSDIKVIDDVFYTKKDMKIVESGYLEGNFYWNKHYYKIKEGKKHGKWYHSHLTHKHSNYKLGELDGLCESWYNYYDKRKKEEINFKNGRFNGLAKSWYDYGQLESEIIFKDGKIEKVIGIWDEDGNPLNIKFDRNKIYFDSDWENLETNMLSKALLYAQEQYPSRYYPSYFVEQYLVENNIFYWDFYPRTLIVINNFFGFKDIGYNEIKSKNMRRKLEKLRRYNDDINKISFPNKEIKDELTIGDDMTIHLTYLSLLKRK